MLWIYSHDFVLKILVFEVSISPQIKRPDTSCVRSCLYADKSYYKNRRRRIYRNTNKKIKFRHVIYVSELLSGTPGGTRTPGLTVRSRALYPAELQAHLLTALQRSIITAHDEIKCKTFFSFF